MYGLIQEGFLMADGIRLHGVYFDSGICIRKRRDKQYNKG